MREVHLLETIWKISDFGGHFVRAGSFFILVFLFSFHVIDPDPAFVPEEEGGDLLGTGNGELTRQQSLEVAMARLETTLKRFTSSNQSQLRPAL